MAVFNLANDGYVNAFLLLLFLSLSAIYFNMTANAWNNIVEGIIDDRAIKKSRSRRNNKSRHNNKSRDNNKSRRNNKSRDGKNKDSKNQDNKNKDGKNQDESDEAAIRLIRDDLEFNYAITLTIMLLLSIGIFSFFYMRIK